MIGLTLMMLGDAGTVTARGARTAARDGADAGDARLPPCEDRAASGVRRHLAEGRRSTTAPPLASGPSVPSPDICLDIRLRLFSLVQAVPLRVLGPQPPAPLISFGARQGPILTRYRTSVPGLAACNQRSASQKLQTGVIHSVSNSKSTYVTRASKGLLYSSAAALAAVSYLIRPSK